MAGLRAENLTKSFDGRVAVRNVSFSIAEGEFCILLGPSGCGKSTVLRLIAGLEHQDTGKITIGDRDVTGLSPQERDVAMVFQNYALYPHFTVFENIAFPLRNRHIPGGEIAQRVTRTARLLDIESLLQRKPRELSGGQRQRVAIGRAIVRDPALFLFDEPLSNLDARLRSGMRFELARLHRQLEATVLYVTHDQIEAMTLGQKIIVLHEGVVQQAGSPRDVYERPSNLFVASFVGMPEMNLIEGRLSADAGGITFRSGSFGISLGRRDDLSPFAGKEVTAGFRPESVRPAGDGLLSGTVEHTEHIGSEAILHVRVDRERVVAKAPAESGEEPGSRVALSLNPSSLHFFHEGKRIP